MTTLGPELTRVVDGDGVPDTSGADGTGAEAPERPVKRGREAGVVAVDEPVVIVASLLRNPSVCGYNSLAWS